MGCHLDFAGRDFNVDDVIGRSNLTPENVWRRGERRSKRREELLDYSRLTIEVSDAEGVPQQVQDAIQFLRSNESSVGTLTSAAGIERAELDCCWIIKSDEHFGGGRRIFPHELINLCSALGLGICVSAFVVTASDGLEDGHATTS